MMKKKNLLVVAAALLPLWAYPNVGEPLPVQADDENATALTTVQQDDSVKFRSIDDVVKGQIEKEKIIGENTHFDKVWARRSYFNIGYNSSTLSPKNDYKTGVGNELVEDFGSSYGFSLQYGRSYRLHKKPLFGNILQFYIDYTGVDVNFSHYDSGPGADGSDDDLYDSSKKNEDAKKVVNEIGKMSTTEIPYYIPWNLEKYEASYGMMVGPSFSIAPFTHMSKATGLHYMKLNMYFHIGYQFSLMFLSSDKNADINKPVGTETNSDFETMNGLTKINWGHGLLTTFGLSLTWKGIGVGYEHRTANNSYKAISKGGEEFGSNSYKFKTASNRIFVSFRLGK